MNYNLSDQAYDNGILLGALLRITGLSISEVQAIIQGNLMLKNKHDNLRTLILEGSEWKTTFCYRLIKEIPDRNMVLNDLNNIFNTKFEENEFNNYIYNFMFYFNNFNFSLGYTTEIKEKLIGLFKSEKYNLTDNKIAIILDISPSTVGKFSKKITTTKDK